MVTNLTQLVAANFNTQFSVPLMIITFQIKLTKIKQKCPLIMARKKFCTEAF